MAGIELVEVDRRFSKYSEAIGRLRHELTLNLNGMFHQAVNNLINGKGNYDILSGQYYDEKISLSVHRDAKDRTTLSSTYLIKLLLSYIFGDYSKSLEYLKKSEKYIDGMTGTIGIPLFYFYGSLTLLSIYTESNSSEKGRLLSKVVENQKN